MRIIIAILTSLILAGCRTNVDPFQVTETEDSEQVDYEWWNPTNAVARANFDIYSDKIKIYYSGTIAPFPAGIEREEEYLIEHYPGDYSGCGCVIFDAKLRKLQSEYGVIYNRRILEWVKEN